MQTFILIIVLATGSSSQAGATTVQVEFASEARCLAVGKALVEDVRNRRNYVLTWGCFAK